MSDLKPYEIVRELDKYIIGQEKAKRFVAIALRNRWRRRHVDESLRDEISPKNIILIGATGVGKTEIARRLSKLTDSPFNKVEASKFTEVGYVGRDVESMVRDLVELTVTSVKTEEQEAVKGKAGEIAEEKILDLLLPKSTPAASSADEDVFMESAGTQMEIKETPFSTRDKLRKMLRDQKLEDRFVELEVAERSMPVVEIFSNVGMEELGMNFKDMMGGLMPKNTKKRKVKISEAREIITQEEANALVDMDRVVKIALEKVEQSGIIFLDEIDKIVGKEGGHGPDVSREGVQRDLLPIVEGSVVSTKYGSVRTDHILFIASGAFHTVKPSDLIPELQGRFPIRVELDALGEKEFKRILVEPKNALLLQYKALLRTEGVELEFTDDAVDEIAKTAQDVNNLTENIGARRLHTLMECLLEDILFDAPGLEEKKVVIDGLRVQEKFKTFKNNEDLSRYIL